MLVKAARARDTGGMTTDAQPEPSTPPKLKRRWLQFSTRALLVIVTVAGVTLGILGWRAERQRRAVAAIRSLGGEVSYYSDYKSLDELSWAERWLPTDWGDNVRSVILVDSRASEADLVHLHQLTRLEYLSLGKMEMSPASMRALQEALPKCQIFW
jgi:hypothetical protein